MFLNNRLFILFFLWIFIFSQTHLVYSCSKISSVHINYNYHSHRIISNFKHIYGVEAGKKLLRLGDFKSTYQFDFCKLPKKYQEKDIEDNLCCGMIDEFIHELGQSYVFVERQKYFQLGEVKLFADILLWNNALNRYVVVELKKTHLRHKHFSQLMMYCRMMDKEKGYGVNQTCGLLLVPELYPKLACEMVSLSRTPIVVSTFKLNKEKS